MTDVLRIGAGVATPLGFLGFVCALAFLGWLRYLKHAERRLMALSPEDRASAVDRFLSRYHLDAGNLTRDHKFKLLKIEIDKRFKLARLLIGVSAAIVFICVILLLMKIIPNRPQYIVIPNATVGTLYFAPTTIVLNEYHERGGSSELDAEIKKAAELVDRRQYPVARSIYEEFAKKIPSPAIYNNLGVLRAMEGRPDLAKESFRKAVQAGGSPDLAGRNLKAVEQLSTTSPPPGFGKWSSTHDPEYDGNFQYANLVVDPTKDQQGAIRRKGDRHFYKLITAKSRGTLMVRFLQTRETNINPCIFYYYDSMAQSLTQPTPGADCSLRCEVSGKSEVAYVGVWDDGDDSFSEAPYRLTFSFEGDPPLPDPVNYPVKSRFAMVDVKTYEQEPNNTAFEATPIELGVLAAGQLRQKGDVDFFKVGLAGRGKGRLVVSLQQLDSSPVMPMITFYDSERSKRESFWFDLAGADLTAESPLSREQESCYIAISDSRGNAETNVPYTIRVECVE